jgi:rod shape-determining protein MreB and related proteins
MFLNSLFGLFSTDLAIDLGTANTLVYVKGRGIVLNEPSVVAVRNSAQGTDTILAVGHEAKRMLGRTPENIMVIRPMMDGVIADFDTTETMLKYFIRKAHHRKSLVRPQIVIAVPSGSTQVEKNALRESAISAGAREVYLITEPMAAAIGANLPVTEATGNVIVDIGAGTTEVCVISLAGTVYSLSERVGGDKMDEAILLYIQRTYNLLIGLQTAELIKIALGTAHPMDKPEHIEVKGRDLVTGIPKMLTINSEEVAQAISEQVETIVRIVRTALEQMPPQLSADVVDKGIVLTGGGALLKNLDTLLREVTGVPITVADDPLITVVEGAGKVLDNLSILKEVSVF